MRIGFIFPALLGIAGLTILLWLGFWQLARLEWKQEILAQIDAKIAATPVALARNVNEGEDNRISVRIRATFGFEEVHVITSDPFKGPGYRIITPALTLPDYRKILLDMGYIPQEEKDDLRGPVTLDIIGNLLWPDEVDRFTPEPNLLRNIWFARDVDQLAAHFDTEPILVVARDFDQDRFASTPVMIGHNIPNNHLQYAITWFGMAVVWLWMTGLWIWHIRRKTD